MLILCLSLLASSEGFAAKKRVRTVDCTDGKAVAIESVAYHLTGAADGDMPLTCALKMKFKYFDAGILDPVDPLPKFPDNWLWFEVGKDSYVVNKVEKVKKGFLAYVTFTMKGKKYEKTYLYEPWDLFHKVGVCGIVSGDEPPHIFRADCRK